MTRCMVQDTPRWIAAERRQNVAPGASPGFSFDTISAPEGRKNPQDSFAPPGLGSKTTPTPGLRPGLHSAAAPRLKIPCSYEWQTKTRYSRKRAGPVASELDKERTGKALARAGG